MTISSNATVPTAHASRYLQQLCKHWRHNLTVEFSETKGTIIFPRNARGADWPGDATLKVAGARKPARMLPGGKFGRPARCAQGVARHIDRFAFREAPLTFKWQDGQAH
jgi:uncharacterized protein